MTNIGQIMGCNLRHFREAKGLTQMELAGLVNVSGSYIGYIERGKQNPSMKLIEKICDILGITPAILLTSSTDINPVLSKLINLLSDKSPNMINFIYEVAMAYHKSLQREH